ncbi:LysR family transcriptional regulator [Ornithinibacillus sp. 4-3]|uniref:LysR family transcriptional regulator n=1 Tax=Ornithinibacillus sp. 4-3 TaxID=3231488 RepID=A0AB39HLA2_9BACI
MEEKDCLILLSVYKEQNLGRAAKQLYLTPPAITYRIHQLESRFSITIIKRNGNQIYFTPEGEQLVDYAKKTIRDLEHLKNSLQGFQGTLRMGVASIFALSKLPNILDTFLHTYPDIKTHLNTNFSEQIFNLLVSGNIHLAIVRGNYEWPDYKYLIRQENLCIISMKPIHIEELPQLPCIQVNYPASKNFSKQLDDWWFERFNKPKSYNMEVNDFHTAIALVKKGLGYAVVPEIFLSKAQHLYQQPIISKDGNPILLNTWLFCTNKSEKLPIVEKFIRLIKETPKEYL